MRFKLFLESTAYDSQNMAYYDIGHKGQNHQAYTYTCGENDIDISGYGDNEFHSQKLKQTDRIDYAGRVEHDRKMVSVAVHRWTGEGCFDYLVKILKLDFPGYAIYKFSRAGSPEKLP